MSDRRSAGRLTGLHAQAYTEVDTPRAAHVFPGPPQAAGPDAEKSLSRACGTCASLQRRLITLPPCDAVSQNDVVAAANPSES